MDKTAYIIHVYICTGNITHCQGRIAFVLQMSVHWQYVIQYNILSLASHTPNLEGQGVRWLSVQRAVPASRSWCSQSDSRDWIFGITVALYLARGFALPCYAMIFNPTGSTGYTFSHQTRFHFTLGSDLRDSNNYIYYSYEYAGKASRMHTHKHEVVHLRPCPPCHMPIFHTTASFGEGNMVKWQALEPEFDKFSEPSQLSEPSPKAKVHCIVIIISPMKESKDHR